MVEKKMKEALKGFEPQTSDSLGDTYNYFFILHDGIFDSVWIC